MSKIVSATIYLQNGSIINFHEGIVDKLESYLKDCNEIQALNITESMTKKEYEDYIKEFNRD
jgi:F420-0:gamma-glutamyl ligase